VRWRGRRDLLVTHTSSCSGEWSGVYVIVVVGCVSLQRSCVCSLIPQCKDHPPALPLSRPSSFTVRAAVWPAHISALHNITHPARAHTAHMCIQHTLLPSRCQHFPIKHVGHQQCPRVLLAYLNFGQLASSLSCVLFHRAPTHIDSIVLPNVRVLLCAPLPQCVWACVGCLPIGMTMCGMLTRARTCLAPPHPTPHPHCSQNTP
jgi:hypothetical protein